MSFFTQLFPSICKTIKGECVKYKTESKENLHPQAAHLFYNEERRRCPLVANEPLTLDEPN